VSLNFVPTMVAMDGGPVLELKPCPDVRAALERKPGEAGLARGGTVHRGSPSRPSIG
jgi:hypothetical protein